jgi:hypothetical protein
MQPAKVTVRFDKRASAPATGVEDFTKVQGKNTLFSA